MAEFKVTYGFNCRRFLRHTIEADTIEEAERIAREQAEERISADMLSMENSSDFGSHEELDAYVFIDADDPELDMSPAEFAMPELDGDPAYDGQGNLLPG